MKNEENVVQTEVQNEIKEDKETKVLKGIGLFFLMLLGYLLIPQLVGSTIYYSFHLSETVSMIIGNTSYLIILLIVFRKMLLEKIKDYGKNFPKYFRTGVKYWGIGFAVMIVSNLILSYLVFPGEISANEEVNREFISNHLIIGFYYVVLLAPFVEEMLFRFGIKKMVPSKKWFPLATALLFGLPHALTDISAPLELLYVIPYGALGFTFGLAYQETDNIFTSMTFHAMHNFISFMTILSL